MTNPEPNFLKSIKFEKDFHPFKEGTEINFGGEEEVQRMIEFYLKNQNNLPENTEKKSDEEISKNAKRFKINCVLGNNGGGKSRLFECISKKITGRGGTSGFNKIKISPNRYHGGVVLDDFFKLTYDGINSCNNKILNNGYNGFFSTLIKFLVKNEQSNLFKNFGVVNYNMDYNHNFKNNPNYDVFQHINSFYIIHEMLKFLNGKKINKGFVPNFQNNKHNISHLLLDTYFIIDFLENFFTINIGISFGEEINLFEQIIGLCNEFFDLYTGDISNKDIVLKLNEYIKILDDYRKKGPHQESTLHTKNIRQKFNNEFMPNIKDFFKHNKYDFGFNFIFSTKEISIIEDRYLNNSIFSNNISFPNVKGFFGINRNFSFMNMSSGEKLTYIRFANTYQHIYNHSRNSIYRNFTILIDEPDLHLHLDWQRQYIQKLIDVFSTLDSQINLHFVIATHSPFIISDLPTECMVVVDKSEKNKYNGEFVEVKEYSDIIKSKDEAGKEIQKFEHQTFGANYIDIIKNGFFFENKQMLMGSFAQNNIEKVSKKLKAKLFIDTLGIDKDNFGEKIDVLNVILNEIGEEKISHFGDFENKIIEIFKGIEEIRENIGDDFLQDNLMYLK